MGCQLQQTVDMLQCLLAQAGDRLQALRRCGESKLLYTVSIVALDYW